MEAAAARSTGLVRRIAEQAHAAGPAAGLAGEAHGQPALVDDQHPAGRFLLRRSDFDAREEGGQIGAEPPAQLDIGFGATPPGVALVVGTVVGLGFRSQAVVHHLREFDEAAADLQIGAVREAEVRAAHQLFGIARGGRRLQVEQVLRPAQIRPCQGQARGEALQARNRDRRHDVDLPGKLETHRPDRRHLEPAQIVDRRDRFLGHAVQEPERQADQPVRNQDRSFPQRRGPVEQPRGVRVGAGGPGPPPGRITGAERVGRRVDRVLRFGLGAVLQRIAIVRERGGRQYRDQEQHTRPRHVPLVAGQIQGSLRAIRKRWRHQLSFRLSMRTGS